MKTRLFFSPIIVLLFGFWLLSCDKSDSKLTPTPGGNPSTLTLASISPLTGSEGARVIISGTGFSTTPSDNVVKFGTISAKVDSSSATRIVTIVPKGATDGKITVEVGGKSAVSSSDFIVVTELKLDNYTQSSSAVGTSILVTTSLSGFKGDAITQYGHVWSETNILPTVSDSKTEFGPVAALTTFPFIIKSEIKGLKPQTKYYVRTYVTTAKGTFYSSVSPATTQNAIASINGSWVEKARFPTDSRFDFKLVPVNEKIYLIGGGSYTNENGDSKRHYDAWEYDSKADAWKEMAKLPITHSAIFFPPIQPLVANGKIFFPAGVGPTPYDVKANVYEFDPDANKWSVKGSLPDDFDPAGTKTFVIGNKAYFVGHSSNSGFMNSVWEYDILSDKWNRKADYPGNLEGRGISGSYKSKGYLLGPDKNGREVWSYEPNTDHWTNQNAPSTFSTNGLTGISGAKALGYIYYPSAGGYFVSIYDLETNSYTLSRDSVIPFAENCSEEMIDAKTLMGDRLFTLLSAGFTPKPSDCQKQFTGKLYEFVKK